MTHRNRSRIRLGLSSFLLTCAALYAAPQALAQAQMWVATGGPAQGGIVRSSFAPGSGSGDYWAAIYGAGMYKSADGGNTWTPINNGLTHKRVRAMQTNGVAPYRGYVATLGGGVFKTTDGGANWGPVSTGLACTYVRALRVAFDTAASDSLLAGTACRVNSGVYRSVDGGANWSATGGMSPGVTVNGISTVAPSSNTAINLRFAATSDGIYKSTDLGVSWVLSNGAGTNVISGPNGPITYDVAATYDGTNLTLIAAVEGGGLFRSTDQGANWTKVLAKPPVAGISTDVDRNFYAAIDGEGVWRSSDRGLNWTKFVNEAALPSVRSIVRNSLASNSPYFIARTVAGMYRSDDSGATWSKMSVGLPGGYAINLQADFRNSNGDVYAAAADGVYVCAGALTSAGNCSFTKIGGGNLGHMGSGGHVLLTSAGLYATTSNLGVFKLVGGNWVAMNNGLPNMAGQGGQLRGDPNNPNGLWLGLQSRGVYYSADAGANWVAKNGTTLTGSAMSVRHMQTTPSMVLISTDAGLYQSTDSGASWSKLPFPAVSTTTPSYELPADHLAIDGASGSIYAAVYQTNALGAAYADSGVWKSADGGATWTQSLAGRKVHEIKVARSSASSMTLYAGIWERSPNGGAWQSTDNGASWTPISSGLTNNLISSFGIVNGVLQAVATHGGGVYGFNSSSAGTGSGTHNAAGTYTWNPSSGAITFNWISTDFVCAGPTILGPDPDSQTGVTITATTMTWANDGMTWTRASGTAGDIVGTWTSTESGTGNQYTATFNANGTGSVTGVIVQCGADGGQNPAADSQHWQNGYHVQFRYQDLPKTASAVSVTGPGITGSAALTYNQNFGTWDSWTSPSTPLYFGTNYPAGLPYTYTFSITDTSTWTATSTVACFQVPLVTNLSPMGSVMDTPTFSWTGIGDASAVYGVELHDNSGNNIWQTYNIVGTSVAYGGPPLTPGMNYNYNVVVNRSSSCGDGASFASGSFIYGSGGGTDTMAPTVPADVNAVAVGPNQINVFWNPSTDNVGVAYYQVYRDGVAAGTPAGASNTFWPDYQVSAGSTYTYAVAACDGASPNNCSAPSGPVSVTTPAGSGVSQFDGTYNGSWSVTCPACPDTAAGTFTTTVVNGLFTNTMLPITSGTHGIRLDSGTVSASGAITASGDTPAQCSNSVTTITGQITTNTSGGAEMTMTSSRPASDVCAAEFGTLTATRVTGGTTTSSTTTSTQASTTTTGGSTSSTTSTTTSTTSGSTTSTTASTTTTTLAGGGGASLVAGWNLLGNGLSNAISVSSMFGDKDLVSTVWKWIASSNAWAFYTPTLPDGGAAYAAGKGYTFLTTIDGGEGFWVNAKNAHAVQLSGDAVPTSHYFDALVGANGLPAGWSLIAIGDNKTPGQFVNAIAVEPPAAGTSVATSLTTLWAWDAALAGWYFYAPSLVNAGTQAAYISSKGYLDFATADKRLSPTTGFWVNHP